MHPKNAQESRCQSLTSGNKLPVKFATHIWAPARIFAKGDKLKKDSTIGKKSPTKRKNNPYMEKKDTT